MNTIESVAMPACSAEPRMGLSGSVYYRHYRITTHAIERYIERIGGDAGNLIADLGSAGLFDINRKGLSRKVCACVAKCGREGGWALTNGKAVFLVKPSVHRQAIVTTIPMEEHPLSDGKAANRKTRAQG
ncbi:TPA: hypothetical protein ACOEHG_002698 [Enterobacter ludwigii]